ncbi:sigma 54-interacting transcriptional regulator [Candidatus Dependentiae bacterium]|nr:sigma 54-interacting transcriptional regulator [Candidatus Dependentiae bacterium]
MEPFNIILSYVMEFIGSYPMLLVIHVLSLFLKLFIAINLIFRFKRAGSSIAFRSWVLLLLVIVSASVVDFSWVMKSVKAFVFPSLDYRVVLLIIRLAWGFMAIQYQALSLFMNSLLGKARWSKTIDYIFLISSFSIFIFFCMLAFYDFNCISPEHRPSLELFMLHISSAHILVNLTYSSFLCATRIVKANHMPRILRKQLKLFVQFLMIPYVLSELIQVYPFNFSITWVTNNYMVVSLTTLLLTYAIYHCIRKVMGLRFLNFQSQVQSTYQADFIEEFKSALDQLSHITSLTEVQQVAQDFFAASFRIPAQRTKLYVRPSNASLRESSEKEIMKDVLDIEHSIETYLDESALEVMAKGPKLLAADEIAFSNFYEENAIYKNWLLFLDAINADIFVPIYKDSNIVAYIIVERYARVGGMRDGEDFYHQAEQDQMVIFANYLGNIINLLQHRNLRALIRNEKELQDELFHKHQEINQFKESMRLFLQQAAERKVGIIFYRNRNFSFGNQAARDMIGININMHRGHPLSKTLRELAQQVLEYKAPESRTGLDHQGNPLVFSGVLNLEHNNVIITVHYPEVSDLVKHKINLLKDPTAWDYLLYLETTPSGKLINQLIPSSTPTLLNFKIELLKAALSKKAILLSAPEEDLEPTVEVLHHISLREQLYILNLQGPTKNIDTATKFFGINALFGSPVEAPLFEKLNNNGTLCIKNIQFLDLDTQEQLAEYLRYGTYKVFKSNQRISAQVRLIFSTSVNLANLVQEGKFSQKLLDELKITTINMPSLIALPEQEMKVLIEDVTEQAVKNTDFKYLLEFTDKERSRIVVSRPESMQELREKIHQLLVAKSKKNQIYQEVTFDPAYNIGDPEIAEAVRLGKYALKDSRIMAVLWNKFKSQNKIATLLGVNRSSVNRRCKEYNLI